MLIPPHVPLVLSKHAGAGDSADRPALSPACLLLFFCASRGGPPTHSAGAASSQLPLLLTCHQNRRPERLFGTGLLSRRSFTTSSPDLRLHHGRSFFDEGSCSQCRSTGSAAGLPTVSGSSVVLCSHSGRRGLVIFQAWSVRGVLGGPKS